MFFGATVSEQRESKNEIALILYISFFLQNTSFRSEHKIIRAGNYQTNSFASLYNKDCDFPQSSFVWKQSYSFDLLKLLKSGPLLWHLCKKHILLKSDHITLIPSSKFSGSVWKVVFFTSKIENKKMFWWLQTSLNKCYKKIVVSKIWRLLHRQPHSLARNVSFERFPLWPWLLTTLFYFEVALVLPWNGG